MRSHGRASNLMEYEVLTRRGQIRRMRQVAGRAIELFGLAPSTLSLLDHAFNTTFLVIGPDGRRYVLHILRPPDEPLPQAQWQTRIESELWWLDRVGTDLQLPVPLPLRTPTGDGAVSVALQGMEPARLCTLFHWVNGRFLRRHFTPTHLEAVGRLTARLHRHSEHLRVPAWFDRPHVDLVDEETEESVADVFSNGVSTVAADVMREVLQWTRRAQEELGNGPKAVGLIHADIHQRNYLFQGRDVSLIDFGDCGWGHHLYDLAVTLSELADLPHHRRLRAALLSGYRQVRTLSPRHEALIDSFVMLREVQNLTWFVKFQDDPSYRSQAGQIRERVAALERLAGAG